MTPNKQPIAHGEPSPRQETPREVDFEPSTTNMHYSRQATVKCNSNFTWSLYRAGLSDGRRIVSDVCCKLRPQPGAHVQPRCDVLSSDLNKSRIKDPLRDGAC